MELTKEQIKEVKEINPFLIPEYWTKEAYDYFIVGYKWGCEKFERLSKSERNKKIIQQWKNGVSTKKLAKIYDVSIRAIQLIVGKRKKEVKDKK